ncbi:MAG: RNase J family beta-CASP ribonuclease [Patescibacteria group bacterium]|nr:RNase J family beta-CASP ribonuclease [Patescibacteria group bacterium]
MFNNQKPAEKKSFDRPATGLPADRQGISGRHAGPAYRQAGARRAEPRRQAAPASHTSEGGHQRIAPPRPSHRPGKRSLPADPTPNPAYRQAGHAYRQAGAYRPGRGARQSGGQVRQSIVSHEASYHAPHTPHEDTTDMLRFVALGGLDTIGRNMMFFEYKNEIVVIDAGLQFPEENTPGVDYIIPNTEYLEAHKENVRAIIITHAHYDHIGALPYVMDKLGNPPIYTSSLSRAIIEKRQDDFPNRQKLVFVNVKPRDVIQLSNHFKAEFFTVEHTIPESVGVVLSTPAGKVVSLGDFKIEYDAKGVAYNLDELERVGKMGITAFMTDSTGADVIERAPSERIVEKNLEELFEKAEGRIIVAMFASVLTRIGEVIKIAGKLGRHVALSGYSMKSNVQIAQNLGLIKTKDGAIIPLEEIHKYRDNKLLILSTGAQGESNASLMKIINGEHRQVSIRPGDTVMLSSSVIPGNERSVQTIKDDLARQGAIIYHSDIVDIHSSGHATKGDLQLAMKLLNPKFLIPVHGYYYKRFVNAQNAVEIGIPRQNVFLMENGQVAAMNEETFRITKETVPASYVMVDGLGVGDVEEVVLRDRRALAQEGMVVVIVTIDRDKGGHLLKSPDIISRGFIFLKEHQELLEEMRKRIRALTARLPASQPLEPDYLKTLIRDQLGQFLYNKTRRRPMILPVVIEI